jgi:hypothetical protein
MNWKGDQDSILWRSGRDVAIVKDVGEALEGDTEEKDPRRKHYSGR